MAVVTLEGGPLNGANMTISDNIREIHYPIQRVTEGFEWDWERMAFVWRGEGTPPSDEPPARYEKVVYREVRPGIFGVVSPKQSLGK